MPSGEAASFANGKGKKLYIAYQERLKTLNAADFGDLLLENIRLFRQNADVLGSFQERFKFILVDEYQDTNVAQYLWLKLLAQTTQVGTAPSSSSPGRAEGASPGDPRLADLHEDVDGRNIGERSDAVLRTAMSGHDGRKSRRIGTELRIATIPIYRSYSLALLLTRYPALPVPNTNH